MVSADEAACSISIIGHHLAKFYIATITYSKSVNFGNIYGCHRTSNTIITIVHLTIGKEEYPLSIGLSLLILVWNLRDCLLKWLDDIRTA